MELPQNKGIRFTTDGGLETTAIFKDGIELPAFSSISLMRDDKGKAYLKEYFKPYLETARETGLGFIFESPTWRASSDWADAIGVGQRELLDLNKQSIQFLAELKEEYSHYGIPLLISGCIGPRGDGYQPGAMMTAKKAKNYHLAQIKALSEGGADFITALTLSYVEEAIGIVDAAKEVNIPVAISFTVETDGNLPTGDSVEESIRKVDQETDQYASYFMINCAHPSHFLSVWKGDRSVLKRLVGIRANASTKSHAELDNSTTLDEGDHVNLAKEMLQIEKEFPHITILGGCCGTDIKHIREICARRSCR